MAEFWFNTSTGEVEEGRVSDWARVMGPYPTREEAEHALQTARSRSREWDEEDRRWHEEETGGDDVPGAGSPGT